MKGRARWLLIAAASVLILLLAAIWILNDWRFINLAVAEFARARAAGTDSTTYDSARDWLAGHGYHVATTSGGNVISEIIRRTDASHEERFTAVMGYKLLGSYPFGERWMGVNFCFTGDGKFVRTELVPKSSPPPRWSVGDTASSQPAIHGM